MNSFTSEDVINIINCDRLENGVQPLVENKQLDQAAQAHLLDMQHYNYYDHTNPVTHLNELYFQEKAGFAPGFLGENLDGNTTLQFINADWLNSPEHKTNLLNPVYKYTGVAIGHIPMYPQNITAVQEFAAVKGDYTTPTVTPIETQSCKMLLTGTTLSSSSPQTSDNTTVGYAFISGVIFTLIILGSIYLLTRLIRSKLSVINIGWIKRKSSNIGIGSSS